MSNKEAKKKGKDPRIECEYEEEIELTDPITGNKFRQKVKIVRYKTPNDFKLKDGGVFEEFEEELEMAATWNMEDFKEDDEN